MSFALEYRKKMQADAERKSQSKKAVAQEHDRDFVVRPATDNADTRANRRQVLAALSLAGIILSVFNSGGLVHYAGGLGYNAVSMRVITISESWHDLMEQTRLTLVMKEIRDVVMTARQSSWQDLVFGLSIPPAYSGSGGPPVPGLEGDPMDRNDSDHATPELELPAPTGPVLRAAVRGQ
jgi:hypothetical protein